MNEVKKINKNIKKDYKKENKLKKGNVKDNSFYLLHYTLYSTLLGIIDAYMHKLKVIQNQKIKALKYDTSAVVDISSEEEEFEKLFKYRNTILDFLKQGNEKVIYEYLSSPTFLQKYYIMDEYLKNNEYYPMISYNFSEVIKNYIDAYNTAIDFEFEDINKVYNNYQNLVKKYNK